MTEAVEQEKLDGEVTALNARIPRELHERLRLESLRRRVPISGIVTEILNQYLPASFSISGNVRIEARRR